MYASVKQEEQPALESSCSSTNGSAGTAPPSALCRYKTGRCPNARVVKPNGALLLLCEFHRSQQNRTKKRSDMKYRSDRARKRLVERERCEGSGDGTSEEDDAEDERRMQQKSRRLGRRSRRTMASPLSPLSTKCVGGMWSQEEVRLLAYFLL